MFFRIFNRKEFVPGPFFLGQKLSLAVHSIACAWVVLSACAAAPASCSYLTRALAVCVIFVLPNTYPINMELNVRPTPPALSNLLKGLCALCFSFYPHPTRSGFVLLFRAPLTHAPAAASLPQFNYAIIAVGVVLSYSLGTWFIPGPRPLNAKVCLFTSVLCVALTRCPRVTRLFLGLVPRTKHQRSQPRCPTGRRPRRVRPRRGRGGEAGGAVFCLVCYLFFCFALIPVFAIFITRCLIRSTTQRTHCTSVRKGRKVKKKNKKHSEDFFELFPGGRRSSLNDCRALTRRGGVVVSASLPRSYRVSTRPLCANVSREVARRFAPVKPARASPQS